MGIQIITKKNISLLAQVLFNSPVFSSIRGSAVRRAMGLFRYLVYVTNEIILFNSFCPTVCSIKLDILQKQPKDFVLTFDFFYRWTDIGIIE